MIHRIEYKPHEVGTHLVEILQDGYKAKSFHVAVSDPTKVRVLDLDDGIVNKEQFFRGELRLRSPRLPMKPIRVNDAVVLKSNSSKKFFDS